MAVVPKRPKEAANSQLGKLQRRDLEILEERKGSPSRSSTSHKESNSCTELSQGPARDRSN
eukprot:753461-Hanusia_phi.AAC.2